MPVGPPGLSGADGPVEIQLWKAPLDLAGPPDENEGALLSEEELERARRLRFDGDRTRFVRSRMWLRLLLAERLDLPVADIRFRVAAYGKPELAPPLPTWLRFNASRSGSLGLYALSRGCEVGVDLEERSRVLDTEAVASRFFSPAERRLLNGLDEDELQRGFYRIWTRKEAVLKAAGVGLTAPMAALDVTGDMARWDPRPRAVTGIGRRWSVHDLDVAPGYAAALAVDVTISGDVPGVREVSELFEDLRDGGPPLCGGASRTYCW
jgi:4'-phosphopantetheinyl transferase